MYRQYADQLLAAGHAYYAFDTPEELDAMRERLAAAKVPNPQYNAITRGQMRNSTTLPEDEVKALLEAGAPYVIRAKIPRKEEVRFQDMIRGWVVVHSASLDDKVLMKSDGMPTYHLANIVDDHLMEITHVIRGEEWLPSASLHVLLYRFFGWEATMPQFAHLSLLLKPDGTGSDGDRLGFPVFPLEWHGVDSETGEPTISSGYREADYLPEAFVNCLAFLGWNPGTAQEIFSMDELIQAFTIERVSKSPAKFDQHKVRWFNEQYLRAKPDAELADLLQTSLAGHGHPAVAPEKAAQIAHLMKERVTFAKDFWQEAQYFFVAPTTYDEAVAAKKWTAPVAAAFADFATRFPQAQPWNATEIKRVLDESLAAHTLKTGQVMQALRLAITGGLMGPDLIATLEVLGPDETARRIGAAGAALAAFAGA